MYTTGLQMGSKVISFRFSDDEVKALEAVMSPDDDSVNQTAARIVRDSIGLSTVSTPVDIKELIRHEFQVLMEEWVTKHGNPVVEEDNALLGEQGSKLMLVRDRTLTKLKIGRQSAGGKAIDAFIKELKQES